MKYPPIERKESACIRNDFMISMNGIYYRFFTMGLEEW